MSALTFITLKETFNLYRLNPGTALPKAVFESSFYSITRTADEVSIMVSDQVVIDEQIFEPGWKALKVAGPLDFSLTGILAGIATSLAQANISIFAISSFDTDYIFIKREKLENALAALSAAGHHFNPPTSQLIR